MQPNKTICQLNICCCRSMKQYSWQTNLRRTKTAVHGHTTTTIHNSLKKT